MVINAIELSFEFPNLCTVSIHLLAGTGLVFVEQVDNQGRITINHEVLDTELNSYTEAVETCFIFRGVVGDREMYAKNILEFYPLSV